VVDKLQQREEVQSKAEVPRKKEYRRGQSCFDRLNLELIGILLLQQERVEKLEAVETICRCSRILLQLK